jgi:hypothetical protein
MTEMNDLAKRWVEALRSGKYKQGRGVLRTSDNAFCCLGVLADVYNPEYWSSDTEVVSVNFHDNPVGKCEAYIYAGSGSEMIDDALWEEVTAGALHSVDVTDLADANDSGATFEEIVEKHILPMWEGKESNHD